MEVVGKLKTVVIQFLKTKANEDTTFTTTFKVGTAANEYLFGLMLGYVDNTKSDAAEIT